MSKSEKIIKHIYDLEKNKKISCGEYLPSENQLMVKFDFSRNTIRKALGFLTTIGKIQPIKGKGYVLKNNDFSLHSFSEHYSKKQNNTVFIKEVFCQNQHNTILNTNDFVQLIKIRYLENQPAIFTKQFVPLYVFKKFVNKNYQYSLFKAILESEFQISNAYKNIKFVKSPLLVRNFIPDMASNCILLTSITHDNHNNVLEYSENFYPLKTFSWSWRENFVE